MPRPTILVRPAAPSYLNNSKGFALWISRRVLACRFHILFGRDCRGPPRTINFRLALDRSFFFRTSDRSGCNEREKCEGGGDALHFQFLKSNKTWVVRSTLRNTRNSTDRSAFISAVNHNGNQRQMVRRFATPVALLTVLARWQSIRRIVVRALRSMRSHGTRTLTIMAHHREPPSERSGVSPPFLRALALPHAGLADDAEKEPEGLRRYAPKRSSGKHRIGMVWVDGSNSIGRATSGLADLGQTERFAVHVTMNRPNPKR